MTKIKNIRSSQVVDSAPKLPTAEQLDHGAIAINYAKGYETLSIKNSEDEIVALPFSQGTTESLWESGSGENSVQTVGTNANALGDASVAEGSETDAHSFASHAEGYMTSTGNDAQYSHTEGYKTSTQGVASHAEGDNTVTNNTAEHAEGRYNKSNMGGTPESNTLHSIGIGNGSGSIPGGERKNAVEVMENGDQYVIGIGGYEGNNISEANTLQEVLSNLNEIIVDDERVISTSLNNLNTRINENKDDIDSLESALTGKQNKLTAGNNITIENNVISASVDSGITDVKLNGETVVENNVAEINLSTDDVKVGEESLTDVLIKKVNKYQPNTNVTIGENNTGDTFEITRGFDDGAKISTIQMDGEKNIIIAATGGIISAQTPYFDVYSPGGVSVTGDTSVFGKSLTFSDSTDGTNAKYITSTINSEDSNLNVASNMDISLTAESLKYNNGTVLTENDKQINWNDNQLSTSSETPRKYAYSEVNGSEPTDSGSANGAKTILAYGTQLVQGSGQLQFKSVFWGSKGKSHKTALPVPIATKNADGAMSKQDKIDLENLKTDKVSANNEGHNTEINADNVLIQCGENGEIRLKAPSSGNIVLETTEALLGGHAILTSNATATSSSNGAMSKEDKVALDKVIQDFDDYEYVVSSALNSLNDRIDELTAQITQLCDGATIYGSVSLNDSQQLINGTLAFIIPDNSEIMTATVTNMGHYSTSIHFGDTENEVACNVTYTKEGNSYSEVITLVRGMHKLNINFTNL